MAAPTKISNRGQGIVSGTTAGTFNEDGAGTFNEDAASSINDGRVAERIISKILYWGPDYSLHASANPDKSLIVGQAGT